MNEQTATMQRRLQATGQEPRGRSWLALCWVSLALVAVFYGATLTSAPAIYVDEPWLGERALALLTEGRARQLSFPYGFGDVGDFNVLMTALHAGAIDLLGYGPTALRVVSLAAFLLSLVCWIHILHRAHGWATATAFLWVYSLLLMVFFAAHVGRFESVILLALAASTWIGSAVTWIPLRLRFFFVGIVGSLGAWVHLPGAFVAIVATAASILLLRLSFRAATSAAGAALLGALVGWAGYLLAVDWSGLQYALSDDFQKALGRPESVGERLGGFLSSWFSGSVRGGWLAGPLHEGDLLAGGFALWIMSLVALGGREASGPGMSAPGLALRFVLLAILTLIVLAAIGRASYHYWVYLAPWLSAAVAVAMVSLYQRNLFFRIAAVVTVLFLALRLSAFVAFAWRGNSDDYASRLRAEIPAGATVLATIDNGFFFRPGYGFFAIDDLQVGDRAKGTQTVREYIVQHGIEYIVINGNDRQWLGRARNQPWGQQLLSMLGADGRLAARVVDDYFWSGVPGFHGSPAGGAFSLLRLRGQGPEAITEIWDVGAVRDGMDPLGDSTHSSERR